MAALNVKHIIQGQEDKLPALLALAKELAINIDEVAYIGDDMPDLPCIMQVGLGIAVNDAHPMVVAKSDYTTFTRGGFGAVREVCDLIMQCQNSLKNATGASI
jgi:3-deoxy-D-manno-octulosonate 8-phosphate phosphatase (KDO 8-P phosphatase)